MRDSELGGERGGGRGGREQKDAAGAAVARLDRVAHPVAQQLSARRALSVAEYRIVHGARGEIAARVSAERAPSAGRLGDDGSPAQATSPTPSGPASQPPPTCPTAGSSGGRRPQSQGR